MHLTIKKVCGLVFSIAIFTSQTIAQTAAQTNQFLTSQPASESLVRVFLGAVVKSNSGETVGDINDVIFDKTGKITSVILGVGGVLGIGEKNVGVPFTSLTISNGSDGSRQIVVPFNKEALNAAPPFVATEKTSMDLVRDRAVELGNKTAEKAIELKDQAAKKIEDMKKPATNN
jgi:sporulation protein YlmC with PRC-barrel domain